MKIWSLKLKLFVTNDNNDDDDDDDELDDELPDCAGGVPGHKGGVDILNENYVKWQLCNSFVTAYMTVLWQLCDSFVTAYLEEQDGVAGEVGYTGLEEAA